MFSDILLLENTLIQFYFSLCAFTKSIFEKGLKYLLCLTTERNLKLDKSHFIYKNQTDSFDYAVKSLNIKNDAPIICQIEPKNRCV